MAMNIIYLILLIEVLNLLPSKFDMDYLCMEGYTKLVYNFDEFLDKLSLWIKENHLPKEDAANNIYTV